MTSSPPMIAVTDVAPPPGRFNFAQPMAVRSTGSAGRRASAEAALSPDRDFSAVLCAQKSDRVISSDRLGTLARRPCKA